MKKTVDYIKNMKTWVLWSGIGLLMCLLLIMFLLGHIIGMGTTYEFTEDFSLKLVSILPLGVIENGVAATNPRAFEVRCSDPALEYRLVHFEDNIEAQNYGKGAFLRFWAPLPPGGFWYDYAPEVEQQLRLNFIKSLTAKQQKELIQLLRIPPDKNYGPRNWGPTDAAYVATYNAFITYINQNGIKVDWH